MASTRFFEHPAPRLDRAHHLQDQGLARPVHDQGGHAHGLRRAFIGLGRTLRFLVAEEPNLGPAPGQGLGRARGNQRLQGRPILGGQFNQVLLVEHGELSATKDGEQGACHTGEDTGVTHPCYTLQ